MSFSSAAWLNHNERRREASQIARITRAIEVCLAAHSFDPSILDCLASSSDYPSAADALQAMASPRHNYTSLLMILAARHEAVFLYRLASVCGLMPRTSQVHPQVTLEWLRKRIATRPEAARLALALAGECDWLRSSRKVRAAFVLQALFERMRRRLS